MLIQHPTEVGESSRQPTEPQHTLTTTSPSHIEPIPTVVSLSQPKKTQKHRKTKRHATEIYQSSGPITLVADETVQEERGDKVERAATTVASLDAEQDSGIINRTQSTAIPNEPIPQGTGSGGSPRVNTLGSGEDSMQLTELMELCTKLPTSVLALENNKTAQDLEITHLKKRVERLEKNRKSRTLQLNRRLFKVRIEYSTEKSLEIHRRYGHDIEFNIASTSITTACINITTAEPVTTVSAPITTAGVSVSTVEPSTPLITTTVIEYEDLIIAQTLMKMRSEKSKEKAKERGSKEKSSETATRPTKRVIMREASETTTKPTVPPQQKLDPKDKVVRLQAELDKEERQRIAMVHESASSFNVEEWEDIEARVEADEELVQRLQAEEREKYTEAEQARMLAEFINHIKKVNTFVSIEIEVDRAVLELAAGSSKRDAEEELDQGGSKRQKTGESSELVKELRDKEADELSQEELQQIMKIVPEQWMNVEALQTKLYDSCGVHHVSTKKGIDIYMLVDKEYPLSRGTLTLMLVVKLLVDEDNEMSRELLTKIFI
nr:hypothetical protein [Tanacetum cinerariifolium]